MAQQFEMKTPEGDDYYELVSALQKDIRRGKEEDALYWALQLAEGGFFPHLNNRLKVILNEDVGIADGGQTVIVVDVLLRQMKEFFDKKNDAWYMVLANIIMAMCRAKKTREAESFQTVIRLRKKNGVKPEIPDYALDKHTKRGRELKRGVGFFIENEQLGNNLFNAGSNYYQNEANELESKAGHVKMNSNEVQPEDNQTSLFK